MMQKYEKIIKKVFKIKYNMIQKKDQKLYNKDSIIV